MARDYLSIMSENSYKGKWNRISRSPCQSDDDDDEDIDDILHIILSSIKDMKMQIDHLSLAIRKRTDKLSKKMVELLETTFTCKICHDIMVPPIIFAKCWGNILGCQTCINKWYLEPGIGVFQ